MRIERGGSTYLYTSAAGAPPAENAWFAAGMVQAGLLLHFLARSRRIRIFRYTLAPEPLEDTDHRPLHNLEGPLTMRHESSRKRYTMALAGTAGLALRTRMQTATSETESKSLDLSICVHHYTLRAPCPKGQGKVENMKLMWLPLPLTEHFRSLCCRNSAYCACSASCRCPSRCMIQ